MLHTQRADDMREQVCGDGEGHQGGQEETIHRQPAS